LTSSQDLTTGCLISAITVTHFCNVASVFAGVVVGGGAKLTTEPARVETLNLLRQA